MKFDRISSVLFVDDSVDFQHIVSRLLQRLSLDCTVASDGEEARMLLADRDFDVLITDFRMPRMNGVQLLNWCRANGKHLPVVLMSANADLLASEVIALGDCCATLMMKPFSLAALQAALGAADSRSHHDHCVHRTSKLSEMSE